MFWGFGERLAKDSERPEDRRRAGRLCGGELSCSAGRILDISGTGMRIGRGPLKREMKQGHLFALRLKDEHGGFVIRARIVWVKKTGLLGREIGIRYDDVGPAERTRIAAIARIASSSRMLEMPLGRTA